jgi:hypothetical protein
MLRLTLVQELVQKRLVQTPFISAVTVVQVLRQSNTPTPTQRLLLHLAVRQQAERLLADFALILSQPRQQSDFKNGTLCAY